MKDKYEAELPNIITIHGNKATKPLHSESGTVSNIQTDIHNDTDTMDFDGAVSEKARIYHGDSEKEIVAQLVKAVKESGKTIPIMDFPQIEDEPADEYNTHCLFAGIFPWLLVGGIGDINDQHLSKKPQTHIWLERLMRYKDYRFQRDKMFSFYANDYCQRKLYN